MTASITPPRQPLVQRMLLDALKDHPRQVELFGEAPAHEIAELALDMKKHGLRHPVEVLPDFTLLAGHRRVLAARQLGWVEIDGVVRDDLAALGDDACTGHLIADNLHRRQMGPLEVARAYLALKTLGRPRGIGQSEQADLRDQIGKRLQMSGRNLDRYSRVLQTPPEVQAAVASGKLSVTLGGEVAGMRQEDQAKVVAKIRDGAAPAVAVRKHLAKKLPRKGGHHQATDTLFRSLETGLHALQGRVHLVGAAIWEDRLELLDRAEALFAQLREEAAKVQEQNRLANEGWDGLDALGQQMAEEESTPEHRDS